MNTMKGLWLLFLVVFSYGVFARTNVSTRPALVDIGGVFTFNSTIGRVAKVALEAAVKDVNFDSSVLKGTKLRLTVHDSKCSGFIGIVQVLKFMETDTVAIIGPQTSVLAHLISHVANELQVPFLSFSATDPTLSSSLQFPFFVRTTQNDLYQMTAVADIVSYYGWRDVIAIYTDDDYGRNGIAALGDGLARNRCRISYKVGIPPLQQVSHDDITNILVKVISQESRIIVLHTNCVSGLKVFSVAKYLGMMDAGFVWIATDWLSSVLDSSSPPLPSSTMESMQGVLVLRQHTADSQRKRDFLARWNKLSGGSFGLSSYGLYAYDSVWLIARALDAYFDQGGTISFSNDSRLSNAKEGKLRLQALSIFDGGKMLLENILQTQLIGLTGPIQFNSNRSLIHPAYDVLNVLETGSRRIGYWSNYSGLSVIPPETLYMKPPNRTIGNQKLYTVIWPGDPVQKPRGWVFPNGAKQLLIGVPNRVSFQEFVTQVKGTDHSDRMKGLCIDVFTAAVSLLPYALPYKFIPYGDGHSNPSYSELVDSIRTKKFDAVVGDIAIYSTRRRNTVDFTQPFLDSGLVVVVPFKNLRSGGWSFLRPFTLEMWSVTCAFFLFVGVVVWILEHRQNSEFRGPPKKQLVTILWFSFSTLVFSHKESTVSTLGRLVLLIWLFVVLIITSSYTASLTSILTLQQLYSPIRGIESLKRSDERIGVQAGSFVEQYLIEELHISKSRVVPLRSPDQYAVALKRGPNKKGGVAAVIEQGPYADHFLSSYCKFRTVGPEFLKLGWGFAFPRDSPLKVDISTAILTLSENGDLQKLHDKWLTRPACTLESIAELESDQLHFMSFWGLFLICGIALFVAIFIYILQLWLKFRKQLSDETDFTDQGSSLSGRLHKFLSFVDEKEEELTNKSKRRQMETSVYNEEIDDGSERKTTRRQVDQS